MVIPLTDKMCKFLIKLCIFIAKILSGNTRKLVFMNIFNKNTLISKEREFYGENYNKYVFLKPAIFILNFSQTPPPLFLGNESVFNETIDESMFSCVMYLLPGSSI